MGDMIKEPNAKVSRGGGFTRFNLPQPKSMPGGILTRILERDLHGEEERTWLKQENQKSEF